MTIILLLFRKYWGLLSSYVKPPLYFRFTDFGGPVESIYSQEFIQSDKTKKFRKFVESFKCTPIVKSFLQKLYRLRRKFKKACRHLTCHSSRMQLPKLM